MRCLFCDKELTNGGSLINLLFDDDLLCFKCRNELNYLPKEIRVGDFIVDSLYVYDEAFSRLLLQYKECYDEALADVFIYPYIKKLRRKYRGYTIVLAPSSLENLARRGFNHLFEIFKILKLPIIDCLYKDLNLNQNNLSLTERSKISMHIKCKDVDLPNKILLVDDVLTSGSTLIGCLNVLTLKSIDIKVLTLAYNKRYLEL